MTALSRMSSSAPRRFSLASRTDPQHRHVPPPGDPVRPEGRLRPGHAGQPDVPGGAGHLHGRAGAGHGLPDLDVGHPVLPAACLRRGDSTRSWVSSPTTRARSGGGASNTCSSAPSCWASASWRCGSCTAPTASPTTSLYFLFWSLVFFTGLTVFSIPYVAMGYEMSDDFHERTSIMAVAQWIGQWAWVIAPWFWVVMYDTQVVPERRHGHTHAVGLGGRGVHAAGHGAGACSYPAARPGTTRTSCR
jgi:hypothetical protein